MDIVNNINYTIIIPHKNIPQLLVRCINSIPVRDDIQVIIIDDNSDSESVFQLKEVEKIYRKVSILYSKENKGAGSARNIGLKHARGKWILFIDADDFLNPNSFTVFDKYIDSDLDLVIFGMNSAYSDNLSLRSNREGKHNMELSLAIKGDKQIQEKILYTFICPVSKLFRKSIIENNNILFDEIIASNDTMFGIKYALKCVNVQFDDFEVYCATLRSNSLVTSYKRENLLCRYYVGIKLYWHLKEYGKEEYAQSIVEHTLQLRYISWKLFMVKYLELYKRLPFKYVVLDSLNNLLKRC